MRIANVKVGEEYAAIRSPSSRNATAKIARRVKVLEIVSKKEARWGGYGGSREVIVKRVVVQFMDDKLPGHHYDAFSNEKNATLTIAARQLVDPWGAVEADHKAAWAHELAREETREAGVAQLKALGIQGDVVARGPGRFYVKLEGEEWEKLLKKLGA